MHNFISTHKFDVIIFIFFLTLFIHYIRACQKLLHDLSTRKIAGQKIRKFLRILTEQKNKNEIKNYVHLKFIPISIFNNIFRHLISFIKPKRRNP